MAPARARAQDLAGGRYLEPLGHRLLGFDTFGTSHKINFLPKRARNIGGPRRSIKLYFQGYNWACAS
jgi:hypothetical protein